jgi:PRTRC genetic system protein C
MSVTVTPAPRIFSYHGILLPDINPRLSPEEIKAAYCHQYPELATAAINGPEVVGEKLRYEFSQAIGAKG